MADQKSLREALALIEEASLSNDRELKTLLSNEYNGLKKAVLLSTPETVWNRIKSAQETAYDYTLEKAKVVDKSVHDKPWHYIGGAALISAIIGYLLGKFLLPIFSEGSEKEGVLS